MLLEINKVYEDNNENRVLVDCYLDHERVFKAVLLSNKMILSCKNSNRVFYYTPSGSPVNIPYNIFGLGQLIKISPDQSKEVMEIGAVINIEIGKVYENSYKIKISCSSYCNI